MEKLTVTGSFNKSLEVLRTTDCSTKEKLHHFNNLAECLTHPHLQSNYQQFIRPTIGLLALFCEDGVDSSVRMCAYENLNKVVRLCEAGQQIRKVLIDLYHEIKKNGNERSLRICLSLFGYLIRHVTQKRSRVYVQNILPCLHAICGRRETMLIEGFAEFLHPFCEHLSLSITEPEAMKLIDVFLSNLTVGCATKRRCMAQNTMTVLGAHRKRQKMTIYALCRSTEVLVKNRDEVNTTLGILGLWRLLVPVCLEELAEVNSQVQEKLLEIYDLSIQYLLSCPNHSVINATLEVLIALTHNIAQFPMWRSRLCCSDPNVILSKRNSLKMIVCGKEAQILSAEDTVIVSMDSGGGDHMITMELLEATTDSISDMDLNPENLSLRSMKSTDSSLGGFFHSLTSNTTEFLRNQRIFPDSPISRAGSSSAATPVKTTQFMEPPSPSLEAEVLNYTPLSAKSGKSDWCAMEFRDCPVFSISDLREQSILSYSMRVLCSKYLLTGRRRELIPDIEIRVSIKHLSLVVLANILSVGPELFLQPLNLSAEVENLDIDCEREKEDDLLLQKDDLVTADGRGGEEEQLMDIKEDHFGPPPPNLSVADFLSPLSRSVDASSPSEFTVDPRMTHSDISYLHGPNQIKLRVKRIKQFKESEQFIYEVLLLRDHSDPMLRSDIVFVVQNFLKGITASGLNFNGFMRKWSLVGTVEFLELEFLCNVIVKGLQDEHHTVVKHALSSIPIAVDNLMKCAPENASISSIDQLLNETLNLSVGKSYWVTKSHLCEIVPKLKFDLISKAHCDRRGEQLKNTTYAMLMNYLHDEDLRIRMVAAKGLVELVGGSHPTKGRAIIQDHIYEKVFANLGSPLNKLLSGDKCHQKEDDLRGLLFDLSNQMLDLGNRNGISGILTALGMIAKRFPPVENSVSWSPFNFLSILKSFLKENSLVIFDNTNHTEALKLYCELLAAKAVHDQATADELQFLLDHSLQMMNIFGHIVNNQRPLITHLTQKADLFMSDKELQKMQMRGYFGNKAVYLRIYKLIKVTYDTYKIDINPDVEEKLRDLLRAVMSALNLVLELKPVTSISQSTKLVEEILSYLNALFVWESPTVIRTAKFLFKYFFERNFVSRRVDYEYFRLQCAPEEAQVMQRITEFHVMKPGEFYQEEESHIKLFEPIVIKSLSLYMKSEPKHQAVILQFICQLLTLNVNYAMLDANLEFFKFVQQQLDTIETGKVKGAELLIEDMIRFLFLLNNKKLINNPKIIHITDNLLANQSIRECSLKALVQLSEELFFSRGGGQGDAESHTEKEFIFSILIKFLNYSVVQRNVWLIHSAAGETGEGEEYRKSTREGILAMLEKYQAEGEEETVLEMGHVGELLQVTSGKGATTEVDNWNQVEGILSRIDFEGVNLELNMRIFEAIVNGLLVVEEKVKEGVNLELVAEKWIQLQESFVKRSDEWESVSSCGGLMEMGNEFKAKVREMSNERIQVESLLGMRNRSHVWFLSILESWIRCGVIRGGYSEILKGLKGETGVDRMIIRELVGKILSEKEWSMNKEVLLGQVNVVVDVIVEQVQRGLLNVGGNEEALLEIVRVFYKGSTKTSIATDCSLLDCLGQLATTDQLGSGIGKTIVALLLKLFVDSKRALVKRRSREMVKIINDRFQEEGDGSFILPELVDLPWISSVPTSNADLRLLLSENVDENWLWHQIKCNLSSASDPQAQLEVLLSMKSDSKVSSLLSQTTLSRSLQIQVIECSFENMAASFQRDCIAYNPHVNYLTVPFLLKYTFDQFVSSHSTEEQIMRLREDGEALQWVIRFIVEFLSQCLRLEAIALRSIELKLWDKFVGENLLRPSAVEMIMKVLRVTMEGTSHDERAMEGAVDLLWSVLGNNYVFRMWNRQENYERYFETFVSVVNFVTRLVEERMRHSAWIRDYKGIDGFFDEENSDPELVSLYTKVSFLVKLREELSGREGGGHQLDPMLSRVGRIVHHIVRFNQIYSMAVIPHKYLRTVCDNLRLTDHLKCPVPMMSIGDLRDSDTLKDYVANVKEIGFTSRQQFEEYLMTLLVLLNTEFDEAEYDSQEQFVIRKTCFSSITELLVTIKEFPRIGLAELNSSHTSRNEAIPIYMIHLKKLSEVLHAVPGCNPFEVANLERDSSVDGNCSTRTRGFFEGQFNLQTLWQVLEEEEERTATGAKLSASPASDRNLCLRNCTYNLEWFEIDYNSSVKMTMEISMQMYEAHGERYMSFLLPCMVRLTDLFVTRDQYRWLRDVVGKLHEAVPQEDVNCHQYLAYLMCKTTAVLVGSTAEVNHLAQTVLPAYLKSRSQGVLTGTLKGVLVLFESCVLNNSSIGALNEEVLQLRRLIVGYADRCLVGEQQQQQSQIQGTAASVGDYEEHTRVLWATVFYVLEKTVKLIPDCPFMARVVVYLNRTLRETTNLQLFCQIVNGIERLILTNCISADDLEKFERIALDLVKKGSEQVAIPALKLLMTCVYIGSVDQLEKTQKCNGVVQDDPETILRLSEKVDVLFAKIKVSAPDMALVYGRVLALIVRDLIPAKDVLTKTIKELISSQPHNHVVARILHQVFRSSIDAAYLPLLQDWLVSSLNNFLALGQTKAIWCLTVIFVSASLNVHLPKIFPHVLRLGESGAPHHLDPCLVRFFAVSTRDFHNKLTDVQKQMIVESFTSCTHPTIRSLGATIGLE